MPKAPDRAYHKAATAKLAKDPKAAIKLLREGLKTDKKFARGYFDLARAYAKAKKPYDTLLALKRSIDMDESLAEKALSEPMFASLANNTEFLLLCGSGNDLAETARILQSGDTDEVIGVLRRFGRDLPASLIGTGHYGDEERLPVLAALSSDIPSDVLADLVDVMVLDTSSELDRALIEELLERLRAADRKRYEARFYATYMRRVEATKQVEWWFLARELLKTDPTRGVQTLLACLEIVPTAWSDAVESVATMLDRVPAKAPERAALVALTEKMLGLRVAKGDSANARYLRAVLALPPPKPRLNENARDPWAGERAAVAHPHPGLAIPMANHMLLQEKKEKLRPHVFAQRERLLAFALDTTLDAELRAGAVKALETLGDKKTLAALNSKS